MKRITVAVFALLFWVGSVQAADLLSYVGKHDASFNWQEISRDDKDGCPRYLLQMTSQTWQGIKWTHEIELFRLQKPQFPQTAFLLITFGEPGGMESKLAAALALEVGCPVAILYGIPNQPLFHGKWEDDLIAHTFVKTLETGDLTWPLLFPMTKAAVRAMDAIQAFSRRELGKEVTGFVVSGASKRGWTTWLTAAADPARVKAIVPVVYDNLNLAAQMAHQLETFGAYSEEIKDYTKRGLPEKLQTDTGKVLGAIVDPWSYRDRILMPKLIINGTNDPFWCLDSLNLYWDDLKGPKYVLYIPNAGHGVKDIVRLLATTMAFTRAIAAGQPLPKMSWKFTQEEGQVRLDIDLDSKNASAVIWTAESDTLDFRKSNWENKPMTATESGFTGTVSMPSEGNLAVFGEVALDLAGRRCTLSTQIRILRR